MGNSMIFLTPARKGGVLVVLAAVLALAGCDHRVVSYGSDPSPQIDHDGLRVAVMSFRQSTDNLRIRLMMTNDTSDTVLFKGISARDTWLTAHVGDQDFAGTAAVWSNHGFPDDGAGVWSQEDVSNELRLGMHSSCEVELDFRFPTALASNNLVWNVKMRSWTDFVHSHLETIEEPVPQAH